ncbi:tetratricopeptide repeat protein [Nitrospira sp. Nam80]
MGTSPLHWPAITLIVTLFYCAGAYSAYAQQADGDILAAQAALAYNEQRYEEALALLKKALAFDPHNPRALYYLGLIRLAQEEPEQAIDPLTTLHRLRPADLDVSYQLGSANFAAGRYEQARPILEELFRRQPSRDNLGYYVGFLRYRNKDYEGAAAAFAANQSTDQTIRQLALFYRGLALGTLGLSEQAQAELESAQQIQPMSPITGASVRIQEALGTAKKTTDSRRFHAQVGLGGYYDDNVAVNPNSSQDPIAEALRSRPTSSPGFLATIRADYAWYRHGPIESTATYSLYQTVNTNRGVGAFNIQDHLGGLSGVYRGVIGTIPYEVGGQYTYDYMFLDLNGFLSRHSLTFPIAVVAPNLSTPGLGTVGNLTTLLYRYQVKEFFREPANTDVRFAADSRDAFNNMIGFLHVFRFAQDRYLFKLGYQYDNEAAAGSAFTYTGNRLQIGGDLTLPWQQLSLRMQYDIHWRAYSHPQVLFADEAGNLSQRYDMEQDVFVQLSKPLPYNLTAALQYLRIRNASNIPVYDYTKNVVTLLVTWIY